MNQLRNYAKTAKPSVSKALHSLASEGFTHIANDSYDVISCRKYSVSGGFIGAYVCMKSGKVVSRGYE